MLTTWPYVSCKFACSIQVRHVSALQLAGELQSIRHCGVQGKGSRSREHGHPSSERSQRVYGIGDQTPDADSTFHAVRAVPLATACNL
jgi:hypothetical protein